MEKKGSSVSYSTEMKAPKNGTATVFTADQYAGPSEALVIQGLLEANGIKALVRGTGVPTLYKSPAGLVYVEVPQDQKEQAERLIAEAMAGGASAAEEAEAETENSARAIRPTG